MAWDFHYAGLGLPLDYYCRGKFETLKGSESISIIVWAFYQLRTFAYYSILRS